MVNRHVMSVRTPCMTHRPCNATGTHASTGLLSLTCPPSLGDKLWHVDRDSGTWRNGVCFLQLCYSAFTRSPRDNSPCRDGEVSLSTSLSRPRTSSVHFPSPEGVCQSQLHRLLQISTFYNLHLLKVLQQHARIASFVT